MNLSIGAGISGLSAGHFLNGDCLILEKTKAAGGLAGQYTAAGFTFDYGGHYFHFQNKEDLREHVQAFEPFRAFQRNSKIYLLDRFIPYSLQYHLAYLPERARRIILAEIGGGKKMPADNLEDFLKVNFGPYLYDLFFKPFMHKFYRRPLRGLLAGMDQGSIPVPRWDEVRHGATEKKLFAEGYNPVFYYPAQGLQRFIAAYSRPLRDRIRFDEPVLRIDREKKEVLTSKGRYAYDNLINTMPLKEFLSILEPAAPFPWQSLRHISTLVVNAVLARRRRRFHWLYLPEAGLPFYRAGYYPSRKATTVYLEKTVAAGERTAGTETYREMARTLRATGMIENSREILFHDLKKIPVSYIVFDGDWPRLVPPALDYLRQQRIFSIGRYGRWNYSSMADDIQTARATAALISQ
ncbi:MAG TPA: FAD-dependent oxidoreductase [Candidatus Binatia bacterium]|nr:FAD-dependent oxidoreductase [Candidatus Binatia bacterium]